MIIKTGLSFEVKKINKCHLLSDTLHFWPWKIYIYIYCLPDRSLYSLLEVIITQTHPNHGIESRKSAFSVG